MEEQFENYFVIEKDQIQNIIYIIINASQLSVLKDWTPCVLRY